MGIDREATQPQLKQVTTVDIENIQSTMNDVEINQKFREMSNDFNLKLVELKEQGLKVYTRLETTLDKLDTRLESSLDKLDTILNLQSERNEVAREKLKADVENKFDKQRTYIDDKFRELKDRPEKSITMAIAVIGCLGGVTATIITLLSHITVHP